MPKIIIDNKTIECREGVPVLQAALEAGWDVPHYCYHPALSVVAAASIDDGQFARAGHFLRKTHTARTHHAAILI